MIFQNNGETDNEDALDYLKDLAELTMNENVYSEIGIEKNTIDRPFRIEYGNTRSIQRTCSYKLPGL